MRNTRDSILYVQEYFLSSTNIKIQLSKTCQIVGLNHNCEHFYMWNCEFIGLFIDFFFWDEYFIEALLNK